MNFNNIRILVNDFDKSFAFYNDTLGLECTWGKPGDNFASFNIGVPSGLAIFKAELMNGAINKKDAVKNESEQDRFAIVIQVDDVNDSYTKLKSKGECSSLNPKTWLPGESGLRISETRRII